MYKPLISSFKYALLALAALALVVSNGMQSSASAAGRLTPGLDTVVQQVLLNIRANGWNPQAQTHGQTTGGLFINWQMDNPSNTNLGALPTSHDPQVDLYYLNALAEYQSLHPGDTTYSNDMQRALGLVTTDFANYNVPKGWLYFYLLRDAFLLHNSKLQTEASLLANNFYSHWYDPNVGMVYNRYKTPVVVNGQTVIGDYNVEHTLNCGAALISAGQLWGVPAWVQAGRSTIDHALSVAINPQYNLFYNSIEVLSNGTQQVADNQAKPSTQGQGAEALVDAYNLTHNYYYLMVASMILQSTFTGPLWDATKGGFFFALDMNTGTLHQDYKETRGQTLALIGLLRYNQTLSQFGIGPQLADKEQQLVTLLANNFYNTTYHGFFYRVTPTFGIYTSHPGQGLGYENTFTTEAMGTAMDALQQSEAPSITF